MKKIVGKLNLDHLMRVSKLEVGDLTYTLQNQPELPAGVYQVWVDGPNVEFVKIEEHCTLDPEYQAMLKNLMERSEHN